jgi:2Fe-2S ferredoxin
MPKLVITGRDGKEVEFEAKEGLSVMENIRNAGFDELLALCGGFCSCATCHVYVDEAWVEKVGKRQEDENILLDGSQYLQNNSRLSCQIPMSEYLSGLRVKIAPEE